MVVNFVSNLTWITDAQIAGKTFFLVVCEDVSRLAFDSVDRVDFHTHQGGWESWNPFQAILNKKAKEGRILYRLSWDVDLFLPLNIRATSSQAPRLGLLILLAFLGSSACRGRLWDCLASRTACTNAHNKSIDRDRWQIETEISILLILFLWRTLNDTITINLDSTKLNIIML